MSALLGMRDWDSIQPHVVSLGNNFQPLVLVVTLWMEQKRVQIIFNPHLGDIDVSKSYLAGKTKNTNNSFEL